MLGVSSYKKAYVDECRARVEAQLAAWRKLVAGADKAAVAAFAPSYFATMVLAIDHYFLHRLRNQEGKNGNSLNELRMLCNSIQENGGMLAEDSTIKYDAARSVAGIAIGKKIALDEATFARLAGAFFDEIERKYP